MTTLHTPANPWPTLVFALATAIVWAGVKLRNWVRGRVRQARTAVQHEHQRLTGWLGNLREPQDGPVILREGTVSRVVLPSHLIQGATQGRHRAPVD